MTSGLVKEEYEEQYPIEKLNRQKKLEKINPKKMGIKYR